MAATKTRQNKSEDLRRLLTNDPALTLAEAAAKVKNGMGYAHAYGAAKRMVDPHDPDGRTFNLTRAARRETRLVTQTGDVVEIVILSTGRTVSVNTTTGKVTTRKS